MLILCNLLKPPITCCSSGSLMLLYSSQSPAVILLELDKASHIFHFFRLAAANMQSPANLHSSCKNWVNYTPMSWSFGTVIISAVFPIIPFTPWESGKVLCILLLIFQYWEWSYWYYTMCTHAHSGNIPSFSWSTNLGVISGVKKHFFGSIFSLQIHSPISTNCCSLDTGII